MAKLVPITRDVLRNFYEAYPLEPVSVETSEQHLQALLSVRALVGEPGSKLADAVSMETPHRCVSCSTRLTNCTLSTNNVVFHSMQELLCARPGHPWHSLRICASRLDDNFFRMRQFCEEAAHYLGQVAAAQPAGSSAYTKLQACSQQLIAAERAIFNIQESNNQAATVQIKKFLPKVSALWHVPASSACSGAGTLCKATMCCTANAALLDHLRSIEPNACAVVVAHVVVQDFRMTLVENRQAAKEHSNKRAVEDLIKKGGSIRAR